MSAKRFFVQNAPLHQHLYMFVAHLACESLLSLVCECSWHSSIAVLLYSRIHYLKGTVWGLFIETLVPVGKHCYPESCLAMPKPYYYHVDNLFSPPYLARLYWSFLPKSAPYLINFLLSYWLSFRKDTWKNCSYLSSQLEKLFDSCPVYHFYLMYLQTVCCVAQNFAYTYHQVHVESHCQVHSLQKTVQRHER